VSVVQARIGYCNTRPARQGRTNILSCQSFRRESATATAKAGTAGILSDVSVVQARIGYCNSATRQHHHKTQRCQSFRHESATATCGASLHLTAPKCVSRSGANRLLQPTGCTTSGCHPLCVSRSGANRLLQPEVLLRPYPPHVVSVVQARIGYCNITILIVLHTIYSVSRSGANRLLQHCTYLGSKILEWCQSFRRESATATIYFPR